jgi:hypothetical protein
MRERSRGKAEPVVSTPHLQSHLSISQINSQITHTKQRPKYGVNKTEWTINNSDLNLTCILSMQLDNNQHHSTFDRRFKIETSRAGT